MDRSDTSILQEFPYLQERESGDFLAVNCPPDRLLEFLGELRDSHQMDMLTDVTAIDHFESLPRFEVVYHLYSSKRQVYLRIVTPCTGETDPRCPSVVDLWPTANWHEREAFDMFGIQFEGHPDLRRILMWDGYPYYPLRKEFPLAGKEVEFPSADLTEVTGTSVKPAPMMGGPFHAPQKGPMSLREPRADDESWTEMNERSESADDEGNVPRDLRNKN